MELGQEIFQKANTRPCMPRVGPQLARGVQSLVFAYKWWGGGVGAERKME